MARHQFYIIECENAEYNAPYSAVLNLGGDPGYAELLQMQKDGKLKSENSTVVPRACLKQTPDMLMEEYPDEDTGITLKRFKPEVVVIEADSRGRYWVEKGREELVKKIMHNLRILHRKPRLDEEGLQLEDEMTDEQKKKSLGGRPKKR